MAHNARGFWTYADLLEPAERFERIALALTEFRRACNVQPRDDAHLARRVRDLEVLSLLNCGGFLEHDAIKRLPKLRESYVHGSTLARFPKQIEPQLRARTGLTIHGA